MSSPSDTPSAPPSDDGASEPRLHIRGIKEMPAGHDEELAVIFKEMRRALDLSTEQIADRLATSAEIIAGLESGALRALPESSELNRIVTAYAAMLGLDARPIMRRIEAQIDDRHTLDSPSPALPAAPSAAPSAPPAPPNTAPPAGVPMPPSAQTQAAQTQAAQPQAAPVQAPRATPGPQSAPATAPAQPRRGAPPRETGKKKKRGRLAGKMRSVLNWIILLGFVAALGAGVRYAVQHPRAAWSAFDSLPEPVPRLMRSAWELVRPLENIEPRPQIPDPDSRKSDRLR